MNKKTYSTFMNGLIIVNASVLSILSVLVTLIYSLFDTPALSFILIIFTAQFFLFSSVFAMKNSKKMILPYTFGVLLVLQAIMVITNHIALYIIVTVLGTGLGASLLIYSFVNQYKYGLKNKNDIVKITAKGIVAIILVTLVMVGILSNVLLYRGGYHEDFSFYHGKTINGIAYDEHPVRNSLTFYVPRKFKQDNNRGAILVIHGGAWEHGSKEMISGEAKKYAKQGYLAVTMNYTFLRTKEHKMDDLINDITNAIKQIKWMSDEQGWGIVQLGLSGYSAGGHLSLLYGYQHISKSIIPIKYIASRVGPSVFKHEYWSENVIKTFARYHLGEDPKVAYDSYVKVFKSRPDNHGKSPLTFKEFTEHQALQISPSEKIHQNIPPTILSFATNDKLVNPKQGVPMRQILDDMKRINSNVTYESIIFEGSSHFLFENKQQIDKYFNKVLEYSRKYFI